MPMSAAMLARATTVTPSLFIGNSLVDRPEPARFSTANNRSRHPHPSARAAVCYHPAEILGEDLHARDGGVGFDRIGGDGGARVGAKLAAAAGDLHRVAVGRREPGRDGAHDRDQAWGIAWPAGDRR